MTDTSRDSTAKKEQPASVNEVDPVRPVVSETYADGSLDIVGVKLGDDRKEKSSKGGDAVGRIAIDGFVLVALGVRRARPSLDRRRARGGQHRVDRLGTGIPDSGSKGSPSRRGDWLSMITPSSIPPLLTDSQLTNLVAAARQDPSLDHDTKVEMVATALIFREGGASVDILLSMDPPRHIADSKEMIAEDLARQRAFLLTTLAWPMAERLLVAGGHV